MADRRPHVARPQRHERRHGAGLFHVWGGEGPAGMFPDPHIYDPRTNQWTRLPDMPLPAHGVYGAAFVDGLIWNAGGGTAIGGSSGNVFNQVYRPAVSAD